MGCKTAGMLFASLITQCFIFVSRNCPDRCSGPLGGRALAAAGVELHRSTCALSSLCGDRCGPALRSGPIDAQAAYSSRAPSRDMFVAPHHFSSIASSSLRSKGLARKSSRPASRQRLRSSAKALAVKATIGGARRPDVRDLALQACGCFDNRPSRACGCPSARDRTRCFAGPFRRHSAQALPNRSWHG